MHYNARQKGDTGGDLPVERQLTLRMSYELADKLERAAEKMRRRRSEIVRLALEQYLEAESTDHAARPIDLVRDLLGRIRSGIPDLGQRHRHYLVMRLRRAR